MTRDMTERQFKAALERHGLVMDMGGWIRKAHGWNISVGMVFRCVRGHYKADLRASLARAIQEIAKDERKRAEGAQKEGGE